MMPKILITPESMIENPGRYAEILCEAGFQMCYPENRLFTRGHSSVQETIEELHGVSAVIAGGEILSEQVLGALSELRVVARAGVGYDRVDIAAATSRGIAVTITPTANHEAVAEAALALLFAVAKSTVKYDKDTRAGRWPRTSLQPIRGKTLGVLGLGRIGRSVAVRTAALGMNVIATEKYPDKTFVAEHNIKLVALEKLLADSDYLSLHCPLNDETCGIMNGDAFARMKRGSVLINTARGKLVVESDLLEAILSGHLRGAGLDVFEEEPPSPNNPLFELDNVVVSPHMAGNDELSIEDMGIEAAQCVVRLYQGQWPDGAVVNCDIKGHWKW